MYISVKYHSDAERRQEGKKEGRRKSGKETEGKTARERKETAELSLPTKQTFEVKVFH